MKANQINWQSFFDLLFFLEFICIEIAQSIIFCTFRAIPSAKTESPAASHVLPILTNPMEARGGPTLVRARAHARAADGGFAKSFKFVRNAGPSCSKDVGFDRRQALAGCRRHRQEIREIEAFSPTMFARSRGSHVKS